MTLSMRRCASLLLVALGLASASCNLIAESKSHTLMISEIVATPAEGVAGFMVPTAIAASVYLVAIDPTNPQGNSAQPMGGAAVSLEFLGNTLPMTSTDGGAYYVDSRENPNLVYVVGATYRFVAQVNGDTFAQYVRAPEREVIQEFHANLTPYSLSDFNLGFDAGSLLDFDAGGSLLPDGGLPPLPDGGMFVIPPVTFPDGGTFQVTNLLNADAGLPGYVSVSANSSLTLTRTNPVNGSPTTAVTVVVPVSANFAPQTPSYTSPDTSIIGVLSLVLSPQAYQTSTITIPGASAWASCPPNDFLLAVTGLQVGTNEGDSLFTASTSFAGSADAALAHCVP